MASNSVDSAATKTVVVGKVDNQVRSSFGDVGQVRRLCREISPDAAEAISAAAQETSTSDLNWT
jgi:hypothetical protein